MPGIPAVVAILALAAVTSASAAAATPTESLAAFQRALASGERDAALALLSPQVLVYESGHVERSRDEYAAHHLDADMAYARSVTRKVLKSGERIAGDTAVVWEESETAGAPGDGPRTLGLDTAVLEKRGDGWVIVHVHWSSRKAK